MRVARRHAGQSSRRSSSYNRQTSFALIGLVRNSIDHPRRSYGGWSPLRPARVLTPQRERDIREKAPVPNEASYKTIILWRTTTYGVVKWITKPNQSQLRDGFRFSYVNPEAQRSSWCASQRLRHLRRSAFTARTCRPIRLGRRCGLASRRGVFSYPLPRPRSAPCPERIA